MRFLVWITLLSSTLGDKLISWIDKKHDGLETTLRLARTQKALLSTSTDKLMVVLPTDKAWKANSALKKKVEKPDLLQILMQMTACAVDKIPKNVKEVLDIQKKSPGKVLETLDGRFGVKVAKTDQGASLTWHTASFNSAGDIKWTPVKGTPPVQVQKNMEVLDDAVIFKASKISVPPQALQMRLLQESHGRPLNTTRQTGAETLADASAGAPHTSTSPLF
eukprot:Blabericola_migrator_1__13195@NODE_909_length_6106_cov_111_915218_g635_i0_p3_GENE_NODE_909_length_6106_cov_111_915218_g635_i0NODE_909_length_6106_cov_111_915218_g635_i0_p3_ORF_typecomplete_len221_score36_17Retinal/PF15449_6/0_19_NODE_909_length_6106_cov_111_915218_g635_i029913653